MGLNRLLALAVAAVYVILAFTSDGARAALLVLIPLAVLLAFIWAPEPFAGFTGSVGFTRLARPSPPALVRAVGWVLLMIPLAALAVRWLTA